MEHRDNNVVLLVLSRRVIAELLIGSIKALGNIEAHGIYEYKYAVINTASRKPNIALVEIPEKDGTPALDTLKICDGIKNERPECKIILICPECDKESVQTCIEAKKKGRIEDFLFYDSSVNYLVSKIEALCP